MSLPVYVVHWRAPVWCARSVASLLASDGIEVDLTVIDNGEDDPGELAGALPPNTRVLAMPANVGYTGGANAALRDWQDRRTNADLCVIASHDAVVDRTALRQLLGAMRARPQLGVAGPSIAGRTLVPSAAGGAAEDDVVEVDWVPGLLLVLRRDCVAAVGDFDERFGSYVEDVDYCHRARRAGWTVAVATSATASGFGSRSDRVHELIFRNRLLLTWKERPWTAVVRAAAGLAGAAAFHVASGMLARWRPPDRRLASRRRAAAEWRGLRGGLIAITRAFDPATPTSGRLVR